MRNFKDVPTDSDVYQTYKLMYMNQTMDKVKQLQSEYSPGKHGSFTISEILTKLSQIIDKSDLDTDHGQDIHAYQTAERVRSLYFKDDVFINPKISDVFGDECFPKEFENMTFDDLYSFDTWDWLLCIGLIHDVGKILASPEFGDLPQYFVVGDTFPIGIPIDDNVVFADVARRFQVIEKDMVNIKGFDNLTFSFSHDNYLENVLSNQSSLPNEAKYVIKYHSFYPWILERGYESYASKYDWYMLPLVKLFQKADLYSKDSILPDVKSISDFYDNIINKYIPGQIQW
jgi:inositol oxygenase